MKELLSSINSTDVVLDAALKFHEHSNKLYKEISSRTHSHELRELFLSLAHEEEIFYSSIKSMIEAKSGTAQNSANLVGEYGSYINLIISKIIPANPEEPELSDSLIIQMAEIFEKNKLQFYEQTIKIFTFRDQTLLNQICGGISSRISLISELSAKNRSS